MKSIERKLAGADALCYQTSMHATDSHSSDRIIGHSITPESDPPPFKPICFDLSGDKEENWHQTSQSPLGTSWGSWPSVARTVIAVSTPQLLLKFLSFHILKIASPFYDGISVCPKITEEPASPHSIIWGRPSLLLGTELSA